MTRSEVTRSSLFGGSRSATTGPFLFTLLILPACAVMGGPTQLLTDVVDVKAGERHTCVLTSAGGVKCWGLNHDGQVGDGKKSDRSTPVDVVGLASGAKVITAGWRGSARSPLWEAFSVGGTIMMVKLAMDQRLTERPRKMWWG